MKLFFKIVYVEFTKYRVVLSATNRQTGQRLTDLEITQMMIFREKLVSLEIFNNILPAGCCPLDMGSGHVLTIGTWVFHEAHIIKKRVEYDAVATSVP